MVPQAEDGARFERQLEEFEMTYLALKLASACGAAAIAITVAVAPVSAQPGWGGMGGMRGTGPGMMGPGMMGGGGMWGGGMCNPRAAGLAEWRADRIESVVRPTDAQKPKLDELRKASARAAEIISAACPTDVPSSPVARLELMEKRMNAMLEALKVVRPAFTEFYNALDQGQQSRLSAVGPRNWGWQGQGWRQWQQPKQEQPKQ
jgi:LTXXQ motif family protein